MAAMQTVHTVDALRAIVRGFRRDGQTIGFVPTMGNLHAGHYSLIELARNPTDRVVASVFVNPTQFGPNEDYTRYPRTLDADARGLADAGCDVLFAPDVAQMYPLGVEHAVQMHVPGNVSSELDGAHRPGHFDGVATVVARLFNMVEPDVAVFGQKDYQQLQVIRCMVRDLAFAIEIIAAPTQRAEDGLALSSRNQYLSAFERAAAPQIHQTLLQLRDAIGNGASIAASTQAASEHLQRFGFAVDYVDVRQRELSVVVNDDHADLVALIAAKLGNTRLIDNLEFSR